MSGSINSLAMVTECYQCRMWILEALWGVVSSGVLGVDLEARFRAVSH